MAQREKSAYYKALQSAGVTFDRHYREYTTEELKDAYEKLAPGQAPPVQQSTAPAVPQQRRADPAELPGQRLNSKPEDEPIRVDDDGLIWLQEEVRKPAGAQPRGRRVLSYTETGTKTETVKAGEYIESFEVAGDLASRTAQIKITLPSYQVGTYRDPRLPFKVHTYNGVKAFDFDEVNEYYNGVDLVPDDIKRMYVENVLAYDIRTVVRAIQNEYRQLQLTGKVK